MHPIPNVTVGDLVMVTTLPMANAIVDHSVMANIPGVLAQKKDVPNPHVPKVPIPVKKAENVVEKKKKKRPKKSSSKTRIVKQILMFQQK